jgi:ABC-type transport system involved in multi-copper enzyme maturation permease subunit
MKFLEIFRFEFAYQVRRLTTWLFFAVLLAIAILFVRGNFLADALAADFFINSPFVVAVVSVFGSLFTFVVAAAVAGEAGARDIGTGMHPLVYTAPVSKAEYLGGRFLAAFVLNALILLAVPLGVVLSVYSPGVDAEIIGPFRPAAYLTAYAYIALPNAFMGTAIQFAWATLGRRTIASYIGSVLLFFVAYSGIFTVFYFLERADIALLLDAFAQLTILDLTEKWTPTEKSRRLLEMEGSLLRSRLLWFGIAGATLALTYSRFRFAHPTAGSWLTRILHKGQAASPKTAETTITSSTIAIPQVRRSFGFATYVRQALAILWTSFRLIALSRGGVLVAAGTAAFVVLIVPVHMVDSLTTPMLPTTSQVLTFLTSPVTNPFTQWTIIPLILVVYAGEVVWRERETGLGEITDAAPVPEWARFLGKFGALGLFLVMWMVILALAGMLVQVRLDYSHHEPGLFLKVLLGLQLPEYLLFALLALVIHTVVNQKYIGHLVVILVYSFMAFSSALGIEHNLLVYAGGPGWAYNDMRGFGSSLAPWLWFKLYWAAWALLLAVVARLLWVRGKDHHFGVRLHVARHRLTRATALVGALAIGLILVVGGYVFYNTNVLNDYNSAKNNMKRSAEYERRYARYQNAPQPQLTGTKLHVEIYPQQKKVDIRGTYHLVNNSTVAIDSIHLSTMGGVKTGSISFNRPATPVVVDKEHDYRVYKLGASLQPGDTLQLGFAVQAARRGFTNRGSGSAVAANGTYFTNENWLPVIGYQSSRELDKPGERRTHGLPARTIVPTLEDTVAGGDVTGERDHSMPGAARIHFEAVVGTDAGQVAIAPGALRRTWTKGGRSYFHYVSDAPIGDEQAFFSAKYAVRVGRWKNVAIQIYHHPGHTSNLDRILRSVEASLDYYTQAFGPYPYSYIRLVENPVRKMGAHADAGSIDYGQGFSLFKPGNEPGVLDFPFAVIAHEVAHQWWGAQLPYAFVEGAGLLTESPAWYSAMGVVEKTYGREHLQQLLRFFRQPYPIAPVQQSTPLLRGLGRYAAYRRGPFALHAMSEYMGRDRVDEAYRRMLEKYASGRPPLPTSLDLYRELKAVTPDTLQPLLHDLFAANTRWELKTKKATATRAADSTWQVTLELEARKVVADTAGVDTELPMNEWVELGVFAPTQEQAAHFGETLYLQKHRIRSGRQTITVRVPRKPADAGIDPYHLLPDPERFDNVERVKTAN